MKTKNLIILCVWLALSIIYLVLIWLGAAYSDNPVQWLIWMQNDFLISFVIALVFSVALFLLPEKKEQETELGSELQNIRSRLDALTRELEEIKKTIRE